jgi:hypothetical protein
VINRASKPTWFTTTSMMILRPSARAAAVSACQVLQRAEMRLDDRCQSSGQ